MARDYDTSGGCVFSFSTSFSFRGGFLFYIKRLLNETGYASQRYFSARSEKYPKDTPKERGFRFPLSFGNLFPQTTQEGPAGPSWISPGMDDARSEVLFIFSKTISARSGSSAVVHTYRSALAISPRKLLCHFQMFPFIP